MTNFYFYVKHQSVTQELSTFRRHLGSPSFFVRLRIANLFSFLCWVFWFSCCRSASCTQCCLCLWIVYYWLSLRFSLTYIQSLTQSDIAQHNSHIRKTEQKEGLTRKSTLKLYNINDAKNEKKILHSQNS